MASRNLVGMTRAEIVTRFTITPTQAGMLYNTMYRSASTDLSASGISKKVLAGLDRAGVRADFGTPVQEECSADSTVKIVVRGEALRKKRTTLEEFMPPPLYESVIIPDTVESKSFKKTVCISSQAGCSLSCSFCYTGTKSLTRNLTVGEMVGQVVLARRACDDPQRAPTVPPVLNRVVLMGQGEPLYNWKNVQKAITIMMDEYGLNLSRKRITVSTSGVTPLIREVHDKLQCNVAVSLHAPTNELRSSLMDINKTYPLEDLMGACRDISVNSQPVMFEYVMLDGINDSPAEARELARILDFPAMVNLIPFNAWEGSPYRCSSQERINAFLEAVHAARPGLRTAVRHPKGRDIMAACGQLRG